MNPVAMAIINPQKEHWPSWGSNQQPPVLEYATLPTELWGSAGRGSEPHEPGMNKKKLYDYPDKSICSPNGRGEVKYHQLSRFIEFAVLHFR